MADYYFIRYENGYTAPEVQTLIDRGWLVPETEPLLTREGAANDPEVQEMVREAFAVKWRVKGEYRR